MKKIFAIVTSIVVFLTAFSFASCSGKADGSREIEKDSLISEVFMVDSMMQSPISITVTDKAIVMANSSANDTLLCVYSLDGAFESQLMPKGAGPREALWIPSIQYSSADRTIYAPDLKKQSIFHISDYGTASPVVETVLSYITQSESDSIILQGQIVRMANGLFIAANTTQRGMIAEFDSSGNPIATRVPFPDKSRIDATLTDWANTNLYYPNLKVSPDGKFAVSLYDMSDMGIFMTVDGEELNYKVVDGASPNDIYVAQSGSDLVQGFATKKTRLYTQDLTLSDKYAYQLYIDMTKEEIADTDFFKDTKRNGAKTVRVFDREGNCVKKIYLDNWVKYVAVSPDDRYLYALTESSEYGFTLLRYAL